MFACNTELESPNWRDGMVRGLLECLHLSWKYREDEERLHVVLLRGIVETAPRPYRRYMHAYSHQPLYPGILSQLLSVWQWRTYAAELAGLAGLAGQTVLTGSAGAGTHGDQEEILRSALLLAPGEASAAPYQALLAAHASVDPAPQIEDGYIDAVIYCSSVLDEAGLTPDEFDRAASRLLHWLLPPDYVRFAQRYFAGRAARAGQGLGPFFFPSPPLPQYWRDNVEGLAAEIAHCSATGEGQSQLWHDTAAWLLLEPQEAVPNPNWEMPPAMAEHRASLEKLTLLA